MAGLELGGVSTDAILAQVQNRTGHSKGSFTPSDPTLAAMVDVEAGDTWLYELGFWLMAVLTTALLPYYQLTSLLPHELTPCSTLPPYCPVLAVLPYTSGAHAGHDCPRLRMAQAAAHGHRHRTGGVRRLPHDAFPHALPLRHARCRGACLPSSNPNPNPQP